MRHAVVASREADVSNRKWKSLYWLVLAGLCGCQTTGDRAPFRLNSFANSSPQAGGTPSVAYPNESKGLLKSLAPKSSSGEAVSQDLAAAQNGAKPGYMGRVSQPFQQVAHTVRESLTIEPRKVPALDATSLAQDPGPLQPGLYLSAARMMEQRGQIEEAEGQYRKLLSLEPGNVQALVGVARLQHRQNKMEDAIASYQKAIELRGQDPVILNDLALCYGRAGRREEAIQALRIALAANPSSLLYRNNLAAVLVESGRAAEAVEVLSQTHGPAIANYNVGYLLHQQGKSDSARGHFDLALQADPNFRAAQVMIEKLEVAGPEFRSEPRTAVHPNEERRPVERTQASAGPLPLIHQESAANWSASAPVDATAAAAESQLVSHAKDEEKPEAGVVRPADFFALPMPESMGDAGQKLRHPRPASRPTQAGLIAPSPANF